MYVCVCALVSVVVTVYVWSKWSHVSHNCVCVLNVCLSVWPQCVCLVKVCVCECPSVWSVCVCVMPISMCGPSVGICIFICVLL